MRNRSARFHSNPDDKAPRQSEEASARQPIEVESSRSTTQPQTDSGSTARSPFHSAASNGDAFVCTFTRKMLYFKIIMDKPFHLVVRFSDTMFGMGDVVALHNAVVAAHGAVWFGKLGQTFAQGRIDMLNQQVEKKIPTFLYLVKGNRRKSTTYRAPLLLVSKEYPNEKELIPAYYVEKDLIQFMNVWMKIGQIEAIDITEMDKLKANSSVFPIAETLVRSSSGYFLVRESESIF